MTSLPPFRGPRARRGAWLPLRRTALRGLAALAVAAPLAAHELWLEPSPAAPASGELVRVGMRVGEAFRGEPVARDESRILRFTDVAPDGTETPIVGWDGREPFGFLRPSGAGVHALLYVSTVARLELPAERFEAYLAEEGLGAVIAERQRLGESERPGREGFSRSIVALLAVDGVDDGGWSRRLGLPLEIVPEASPFHAADAPAEPPGELSFLLLADGEPLAGCLLTALRRDADGTLDEPQEVRTDASGRAVFHVDAPGDWIVHGVRMARAAESAEVDWRSTWTSLTWRVERTRR